MSWKVTGALDSRFRGNGGRAATFCPTREGGYPESIIRLDLSNNQQN